ncbi:MAG TPA: hypothetical protein VHV83_13190, partial [Armatimonadota bacterium]|nr:hypothetical protein [Armatimonadota bacterium]
MLARTLICFPVEDAPGLSTEAAQLALGLATCGSEVYVVGNIGAWRHMLRREHISAFECDLVLEQRQLSDLLREFEPQVIHVFGTAAVRAALPMASLVGATGVATLGHHDLDNLNPTDYRTVSTVFVPCESLREQVARRLPSVAVVTTGYLLPPVDDTMDQARQRFLAEELGLQENAPVVLHADSFSGESAATALCLIDAAEIIAKHIPGVQFLLAGDGERLGEIEERASAVNNTLHRRAILLPGSRNDIQHLLSLAAVAVGSGRFAMEAVGAGVALVAAGEAGMLGTYTEESTSVAQFTCCGRHG